MKKVLGWIGSALGIVVMLIAIGFGKVVGRGIAHSITQPSQGPSLADEVRSTNALLPKMIDRETRLDSIELGPNRTLTFQYTMVHYAANAIPPDFLNNLFPGVLRFACTGPQAANIRAASVTLIPIYRSNDGREIGRFHIGQSECETYAHVMSTGPAAPMPTSTPGAAPPGPVAMAGTPPSASDKVNYHTPRNGKCWDQYQAALAQIPADAPLGDVSKVQEELDRCVSHG